jgi:hypothetical protein
MKLGSRFTISSRQGWWATVSLGALALSAACGSDAKGGGTVGNIVITDQNNYKATSELTIPRIQTKPQADLDICWPGITKDFLCHDSSSSDINSVNFLQIKNLDESKIEKQLTAGQLSTSNVVSRAFQTSASSTCAKLSQFSLDTTVVNPSADYTVSSTKTYMLLFAHGTKLGSGGRTMLFLEPTEGSTVTEVKAQTDSCNLLDFTADLSASTLNVAAGGPYVLDWSRLTKDGLQNEFLFSDVDKLQLGFYPDFTVSKLQEKFLDLDVAGLASPFYELAITQSDDKPVTNADLASASSSSDGKFGGFTKTNGIWAVALRCTKCQVPTPIAVVILNPS